MRPLALTMQAFGPFAGREHVDFAMLGENPLFLIHGPTGAGKSSILDAICVALYGDSAGGERRAAQMRSHHAPEELPTEVVFEFALGADRYRASRSPEQPRPSRRARDGYVTEPARAELSRWRDGAWHALAARPADVDREVRRLLGLELEQFRQVVLLPQGRFREALNADSARREQILETLFATGIHRRLQEDLARQAASLRERHAQASGVTATLLSQRGVPDAAALAAAIVEARAEVARLSTEQDRLARREADALAALDAARALAARFEEHRAATSALDALVADADRARGLRERRDAGRRATAAGASYQRLVDGRTRLAAATTEAEAREASLAAARRAHDERHAAWQRLREEVAVADRRREERRQLTTIAQEQRELSELRRREAQAASRLAEAGAAREEQARRLAADELARGEAASRIEALSAEAATVAVREAELERARRASEAAAALAAAQTDARAAERAFERARSNRERASSELASARAAHDRAFGAWRAARAAALATTLVEGDPCPVCGSRSHPSPASDSADADGDDERLERAARALQEAQERDVESAGLFARAQSDLAVARSRVEERERRAAAERPADDAGHESHDGRLARLEAGLLAARRAIDLLAAERRRLATLEAGLAEARTRLDALRSREQDAREVTVATRTMVQEREERIPARWRDPAALESRLAELDRSIAAHEAALAEADEAARTTSGKMAAAGAAAEAARRAAADARQACDAAQAAFERECAAAGFADERSFADAMLSASELAELDREVARHEQALAGARERLARAAAGIAGCEPPDIAAAERALGQARTELQALAAARARVELRLEDDARLAARLEETAGAIARLEQEFALVGRLADMAGGRNERRLTFQRYVLATLLDDVLVQASVRLRAMSRGRYWLRRREEVGDKRSAQGLAIEVFDDDTGRPRPVTTLSGGEGFLAALALALGLSDVVGAHAGGVRLETLFVDEGFGSLDPEALDLAMRALLDLRAQGRCIGIISHVEELRRQVGIGIEVVAGAAGSRIRGAGEASSGMM